MKGKTVKKKWPKWATRHKIQDTDFLFLAGDKIKVLRQGKFYEQPSNRTI